MMVAMAIDAISSCHMTITVLPSFESFSFIHDMARAAVIDITDKDLAGQSTWGLLRIACLYLVFQFHIVTFVAFDIFVGRMGKTRIA
jgi:hypothetical protein